MIWLLGGYIWLFIHRPFEFWPTLGALHVERVYMLFMILYWLVFVPKAWVSNRLNIGFGALLAVVLAAWLASPYPEFGTVTVENYLKIVVFYVLLMTSIRSEEDLRKLVLIYLVSVGLYLGHSLWEYRNGRHTFRMGIPRMVGVDSSYRDPNTFAATILYSLPIVIPFWTQAIRHWQRVVLAAFVLMSIACIVLTGSRSGFVGLCGLAVLLAMVSPHRVKLMTALAVVTPMIWFLTPARLQDRLWTIIDPSYGPRSAEMSAETRVAGWHDGVAIWKRNPLLGVGPNAFARARNLDIEGAENKSELQSHHLYGQVLGELGTLGAVAFGLVVWGFFRNALEMRRALANEPRRYQVFSYQLTRAITVTVMLMLVMGFAGHNLYRYTWMWFGAFEAVALYCVANSLHRIPTTLVDAEEPEVPSVGWPQMSRL